MDTKPLESFAKAARRELIAAVSAQASAALALGSVARTERAETVRRLETEIAAHGHEHVIDKVAYTWFNRLIALRFMDAKGYTGAGIVSPAQGQAHGQPEILADAKRGDIDADVVTSSAARGAILGLLDGTRRSTDAEGEAYALLLTEYCRYWHKSMPFMFEREGDYTELLVPAGLLADGGIVARARNVLTEDVCDDVEVIGWLYQFYISERKQEVFDGFSAKGDDRKLAGAAEIPAATQLFTPHWIVRYLVENAIGRLWVLNHPSSRLLEHMDYFIAPVGDEIEFLKISRPEELTVLDPACGSGHMLTYAFDLLYAIYEESGYAPSEIPSLILSHNLRGAEIDPRAGALAAFALTMKARDKDRRFFGRGTKAKICVIEPVSFRPDELDHLATLDSGADVRETFWTIFEEADTRGSLVGAQSGVTSDMVDRLQSTTDEAGLLWGPTLEKAQTVVMQAGFLAQKFAAVVANPPYMGSGNMGASLTEFVKAEYPEYRQDLYACFVRRSMDFAHEHGIVAAVTGDTWMFLQSFEKLRTDLIARASFASMVHVRDSGNLPSKFGANSAFVLTVAGAALSEAVFVRTSVTGVDAKGRQVLEALRLRESSSAWFECSTNDLARIPGAPIAYWLPEPLRDGFSAYPALSRSVPPKQGIKTGDNDRFLRYWFEVSKASIGDGCTRDSAAQSSFRWFPCQKGGQFRRWYGNDEYVVNWARDGEEIKGFRDPVTGRQRSRPQNLGWLFKGGVTWGTISSGPSSFRLSRPGAISESKGAIAYAASPALAAAALGFLNSTVSSALLSAISSTIDYGEGAIGKLPFDVSLADGELVDLVTNCVEISETDWQMTETAPGFQKNELVTASFRSENLAASVAAARNQALRRTNELRSSERLINGLVASHYRLEGEVEIDVPLVRIALNGNDAFRFGRDKAPSALEARRHYEMMVDLVAYSIGCMFGRYSLDVPGLILADQGSTLQDYRAKISSPSFRPDADNVIPFVDDGWFEDDIVERFREFLRTAFGAEHFEENLRFVEESLGVKTMRDYFITKSGKSKFYDDHVQRYKQRPIYWMFSSPKGAFNALIYLHRYTPSTASTVLNEYLREYEAKLTVALQQAEVAAVGGGSVKDQKEADRLRRVLAELRDYEHDVLYPIATKQVAIDLDDGVKVNYPKLRPAVKKIAALEASGG